VIAVLRARKLLLRRIGLAGALVAATVLTVLGLVAMLLPARPRDVSEPPAFREISEAELRAFLPARLIGLPLTGAHVQVASGMNVPATALDAIYERGPRRLDIKIVHSPVLDQVIGFGGAATTTYDRQSAGGYQRRWRERNAIFVESLDRPSGEASFGRVSEHFYLMARGQGGVSVEELRAAVRQVGDRALPFSEGGG
jgi:hypothetical protein